MSWKRKAGGGGFLNGTGGVIKSAGVEATKFEGSKGDYHAFSLVLVIAADGRDEEATQYLSLGNQSVDVKASKDGKSIVGDEFVPFPDDSEGIRFITSMIDNGFPESEVEEGEGRRFDMIEGWRVIFAREKDREAQIRIGKSRLAKKGKKNPTEEEAFEAGKRDGKDKDGKKAKYDVDVLLVSTVVGKDEGGSKGKTSKAAPAKESTKSKKVEADDDDDDGDDSGLSTARKDEVLKAVLADAKDNTLFRGKVSGAIVTWAVENDIEKDEREALREALYDEDYLNDAAERGIISYDSDEAKQPIVLKKKGKK